MFYALVVVALGIAVCTLNRQRSKMGAVAYVISEPCIGTKDNSCVEVCPVDCIHPTAGEAGFDSEPMLYIDPAECIDCDACVEACPVDAISAAVDVPEIWREYIQLNAEYYKRVIS